MRVRLIAAMLFLGMSYTAAEPAAKDRERKPPKAAAPVQLTKDGEKWAEKTLKKMSLEEKVGQLLMIKVYAEFENEDSQEYRELREQLHRYHIGSVLMTVRTDGGFLMRNPPLEAARMANRLQAESLLPLLVAADFERGLSMRLLATPNFPHAMAFGATGHPEYAEQFAKIVARESRAIGVHWNFFPVADVNSNPANPIINTRSYGEDPKQVGDFVAAYIRGSREGGLLSTAKHFPGHGDTDTDTHLALARVNGDLARLHSVELPPFQRAIDEGVDSVMVAHVAVPAVEPDPDRVATVSRRVINDLLIGEMKFTGLVVTDAFDMKGITNAYRNLPPSAAAARAAVDAILAGNDMVLLPSDLDGAYNGLLEAARSGEISKQALDARALRILQAKSSLGLHKDRFVDLNAVDSLVARPEDMALAQQVADQAVTLVKDNGTALHDLQASRGRRAGTSSGRSPYDTVEEPQNGVLALILTDDMRSDWGRVFDRELRTRAPGATVLYVDPRIAGTVVEEAEKAAKSSRAVVIAAYAIPSGGRRVRSEGKLVGSVGLSDSVDALIEAVLKVAGDRTTMVALGNPYLGTDFPEVGAYVCTFSHAPTSEAAAVKAIFSEMPIRGRLPVSIPNMAERGFGLERPAASSAVPAR